MIYESEYKVRIDRVIYSLSREPGWMSMLAGNGKPYGRFIEHLLGDGDPWHRSEPYDPRRNTVTRFAKDIGEKPSTVNRWFRDIYADIHRLNDEHPELFVRDGEIGCRFSYCSEFYRNGFSLTLGLSHIPRAYEKIDFYFAAGSCETTSFTVQEVCHTMHEGKDSVSIELADSLHSLCFDLLAEKAFILGEISLSERYGPRYKLKDILRERMKD